MALTKQESIGTKIANALGVALVLLWALYVNVVSFGSLIEMLFF